MCVMNISIDAGIKTEFPEHRIAEKLDMEYSKKTICVARARFSTEFVCTTSILMQRCMKFLS